MYVRRYTSIYEKESVHILEKNSSRLWFPKNSKHYAYRKCFYLKELVKEWYYEYLTSKKGGWAKTTLLSKNFRTKFVFLKKYFIMNL